MDRLTGLRMCGRGIPETLSSWGQRWEAGDRDGSSIVGASCARLVRTNPVLVSERSRNQDRLLRTTPMCNGGRARSPTLEYFWLCTNGGKQHLRSLRGRRPKRSRLNDEDQK